MTTYLEPPATEDVETPAIEPPRVPKRLTTLTGVATLLLVGLAIGEVTIQLTDLRDRLTADPPAPPAAPAPPPPPPAVVAVPEISVIATPCRPFSTEGVTADGSVAYCVPLQSTDTYMWSLYPGELLMPTLSSPDADPALGICMEQTLRSEWDCGEYLARPSNPGDGGLAE